MSKPDDIPKDVWDATDVIAEPLLGRHERGWVMWPLVWPAREIAARAVMAERERCAKIAEGQTYKERYRTWAWWLPLRDGTRGNVSQQSEMARHADDIAAAIREGQQ